MNRDTIIKLAREAGFITGVTHASSGYSHPFVHPVAFPTCLVELERFAALVAAAEREACANIVENANTPDCGGWSAQGIADDIRARGNND